MQTYVVNLQSEIFKTFRCQKAADSLDINTEKKSKHHLQIKGDVESPFNIGLIVGASGSGKTTLAKKIYGESCFKVYLDLELPVIDQFPEKLSYDDCAKILSGVGLTSVPCWIRPAYTLSNGQKARAEAALAMTKNENFTIIDEWTSVVDRTVGKVMSHCISKYAKKSNRTIVLCACHYDIIEWLSPDWIIDCNKQTFQNRRSLQQSSRKEKLEFNIREVGRETWKYFSKYHYLNERLPGGKIYTFGLFDGENQIGFQCFANYVPIKKGTIPIFHSNRTVIHPDYAGFGLGIRVINETARAMRVKYKYKIMAKFSSTPIYKSMIKQSCWQLKNIKRDMIVSKMGKGLSIGRKQGAKGGFRHKIKTYSFEFVGQ